MEVPRRQLGTRDFVWGAAVYIDTWSTLGSFSEASMIPGFTVFISFAMDPMSLLETIEADVELFQ